MAEIGESSLSLLREQIERIRLEKGRERRFRWPKDVRLQVAAVYRSGGFSLGTLGQALSLPPQTLGNWIRRNRTPGSPKPKEFQKLRLKDAEPAFVSSEVLALQTPRGFSVTGLSFVQVLELFRREIL